MQTQDGRDADGLVKEEFQAVLQYLIVPLMQKEVQRLVATNAPTFSGKSMQAIVDEWKHKLQGAYECLKQQLWHCECPSPKQVKRVTEYAQKTGRIAEEKQRRAEAAGRAAAGAREAQMQATAYAMELQQSSPMYAEYANQITSDAERAVMVAEADVMHAQAEAEEATAAAAAAEAEVKKLWLAWEPSAIPYFLSMDNCKAYSFYIGLSKDWLVPGIHMLQARITPPTTPVSYCMP